MTKKLDKLLEVFYKKTGSCLGKAQSHPDEEMLACYSDNKLSEKDSLEVSSHLTSCAFCAEAFLAQLRTAGWRKYNISFGLLARLKAISGSAGDSVFEIVLKNTGKIFDLLYTNGQVLLGQEIIPIGDLRSRNIQDFRDTVSIVKDIDNIRVEIKIDSSSAGYFDITVSVKNKKTSKLLKDYRVTLIKSDTQLESYIIERGAVTFEHISLGKYSVEISSQESKLANVTLDIKI